MKNHPTTKKPQHHQFTSKQLLTMNFFLLSALLSLLVAFVSAGTNVPAEFFNSTLTGSCGGNCPGGNCPDCKCGTTKKMEDIAAWCSKYSGWNQVRIPSLMIIIFSLDEYNFSLLFFRAHANASSLTNPAATPMLSAITLMVVMMSESFRLIP
jgi:hypothetical protein